MKRIKITKYASNICWWMDCVGQECEVIDVYEGTYKCVRIKVKKNDPRVIENNGDYELEGYIPFDCVEVIE